MYQNSGFNVKFVRFFDNLRSKLSIFWLFVIKILIISSNFVDILVFKTKMCQNSGFKVKIVRFLSKFGYLRSKISIFWFFEVKIVDILVI